MTTPYSAAWLMLPPAGASRESRWWTRTTEDSELDERLQYLHDERKVESGPPTLQSEQPSCATKVQEPLLPPERATESLSPTAPVLATELPIPAAATQVPLSQPESVTEAPSRGAKPRYVAAAKRTTSCNDGPSSAATTSIYQSAVLLAAHGGILGGFGGESPSPRINETACGCLRVFKRTRVSSW